MALKTNYTDAAWAGNRKYNMIENSDGTVSFEDVTEYTSKENSFFGASDANAMNTAVNTATTNITSLQSDKLDKSTITTKEATNSTGMSLASSTYKSICSVSLPAGTWIISGSISYAANTLGYRSACISSQVGWNSAGAEQVGASQSGKTYLNVVLIVQPSATTTFNLVAEQNSGSNLLTSGWLKAIRLK